MFRDHRASINKYYSDDTEFILNVFDVRTLNEKFKLKIQIPNTSEMSSVLSQ